MDPATPADLPPAGPTPPGGNGHRGSQTRVLADLADLRALAHPVRLDLLDALLKGPLTATEAGEEIEQSPTTCSFHLRQLEKYGFVEIAERGPGRRRSWRRTHRNWRIPARSDDPGFAHASGEVHAVMLERYFEHVRRAVDPAEPMPEPWRDALIGTQSVFLLTAEELRQFEFAYNRLIASFVSKWGPRSDEGGTRPADARLVEILTFGVPIDREERP